MKSFFSLLLVGLFCSCQTQPPIWKLPAPVPEPLPIAVTPPLPVPTPAFDTKLRQQAQLIDALMSQNDALTARLRDAENRRPSVPSEPPPPTTTPAASTVSTVSPTALQGPPNQPAESHPMATFTPNAEGLIDLTAADPGNDLGPINPFAVRAPVGPAVETSFNVQGFVRADHGMCALVNDRLLAVGDAVGRWRFTRMEPDVLIFSAADRALRLPFAETRVRHT